MAVRANTTAVVLAMLAAACSSGEEQATTTTTSRPPVEATTTTTVPERPASTTTTAFDPASVEGQVEAAYLKSWDVYANAVYHLELDEEAFAEVYAGEHLTTKTNELRRRIEDGRAALVQIDHDYEITRVDDDTYRLVDVYRNHQVLIDLLSKAPIEPDPNEVVLDVVTLGRSEGIWRVVFVEEVG